VKRAKRVARERELLDVEPRFDVVNNLRRQQANSYTLRTPTGPISVKPRGAQRELPIRRLFKEDASKGRGVDLLALRRAAFEIQWRAKHDPHHHPAGAV
jgi:hypothetical protein